MNQQETHTDPQVTEAAAQEQALLEAVQQQHLRQRVVHLAVRVRQLEHALADAQDAYEQLSQLLTQERADDEGAKPESGA